MNFSEWATYSAKRQHHKLEEIYEEVEEGETPLASYTWLYDEANLSEEQVEALVSWAKAEMEKMDVGEQAACDQSSKPEGQIAPK